MQAREAEEAGDYGARLALFEDSRSFPWGAVWDEFCRRNDSPIDGAWFPEVKNYEKSVLSQRGG